MNNTPLGSMAYGFDYTLKFFGACRLLDTGSIQGPIVAPKCPLFVARVALKGRSIRRHDPFPVIYTPVKISQSKLETLLPHMWSQERFVGSTSTWYVQVLLQAVLDTSDGGVSEMILMHRLKADQLHSFKKFAFCLKTSYFMNK